MPRAENNPEDGKDSGNGNHEADVVGHPLAALELQNLTRCTAEQATGNHHAQPGGRQHANQVGPAFFRVKDRDQERHTMNGFVEMKQESRFEMSADRETDNFEGDDGSAISICSPRHSLRRSKPGHCLE